MLYLVLLFLFLSGLVVGSFLNVLIDRIPKGKGFVFSRSVCDHCSRELKWYDMFPLVSFLVLKGKCRYCKNNINPRMFIVELLTGLMFCSLFIYYLYLPSNLTYGFFALQIAILSLLIATFFIDLENQIIPDGLIVALLFFAFAANIFYVPEKIVEHLIAGFASGIFFFLIFKLTKEKGMGFGDVKFAIFVGFLLGYAGAILAFYAAFLTGALVSIILILGKKKKLRKDKIAFGPFMIIGIIVALFFGKVIIASLPFL